MKKYIFALLLFFLANVSLCAQTPLGKSILFAPDSVNVPESQYAQLGLVAEYIKKHSDELIIIGGFTSSLTPADKVDIICTLRAENVKNLLINKYGINAEKLLPLGVGVRTKDEEKEFNEVVSFFKK